MWIVTSRGKLYRDLELSRREFTQLSKLEREEYVLSPFHFSLTLLTLFPLIQRDTPVALRTPYLRVLGLEVDREGAGGGGDRNFTAEEEEEFEKMGKQPGIYEKFARSIAPSIFGNDGMTRSLYLSVVALC